MEDFMLLIEGDGSNKSPEKMQEQLQAYMGWMEKWKATDQYVAGSPFKPEGHYIRQDKPVLAGGAFLSPDKAIGGYIHIRAKDLNGATEIAEECPLLDGCGIFVRPFLKM